MATIEQLIQKEWAMFYVVNGDDRADCQNNPEMFSAMRNAQFSAWSQEVVDSYWEDLLSAVAAGRNLVREKYVWMMEHSDPEGYERVKDCLPELPEENRQLVDQIWGELREQTEQLRKDYPFLAFCGRPLYAKDDISGSTSVETYQTGELKTYSFRTLKALLAHLLAQKEQGVSLAKCVQENSILCLGYTSLEDAERALAKQVSEQTCGGCCCS